MDQRARRPPVGSAAVPDVLDPRPEEATAPGSTRSLLRSSGLVALGTALSRGTGFLRLAATTYAIGATAVSDTYTLANTTPNIVYDLLLGGVFAATLVPVFVSHTEEGDDEGTSAVISVMLLALVAITVVGVLAAPFLVRLYTFTAPSDVAAEQRAVATNLLRWFMPQMVFYGLTALWTALLNARRVFGWPAFAPTLNNIVVSAVLVAVPTVAGGHPSLGDVRTDWSLELLLGLGTTAGIVVMALALYPSVRRSGFRFTFNPSLRNRAVREVGRMSTWTIGYVVSNQVALFLILILANRQVSGVSTYSYAYIFFLLPYALVGVSLMTTIVPELSSAAGRGDLAAYRRHFSFGVRMMTLLVLPAAVGFILLAKPMLAGLLTFGAFTLDDADLMARNLAAFSVGLLGYSVYLYTLRGFYALRDTRTPFAVNVLQNGLNIALALALEPLWGVPGLALAFGLSYVVAAVVAILLLRTRVGGLRLQEIGTSFTRVGTASLVMAVAVAVSTRVVGDTALVQLAAGVVAGTVAYTGAVVALRAPEVAALRDRLVRSTAARGA